MDEIEGVKEVPPEDQLYLQLSIVTRRRKRRSEVLVNRDPDGERGERPSVDFSSDSLKTKKISLLHFAYLLTASHNLTKEIFLGSHRSVVNDVRVTSYSPNFSQNKSGHYSVQQL